MPYYFLGQVSYVSISATSIKADPSLSSTNYVTPQKRGCYFETEFELQIHQSYTRANCVFECELLYAFDQLNQTCIPWYFPTLNQTSQPCDPFSTKEFLDFMSKTPDQKCRYCLPDCQATIYQTLATSGKFRRCDEKNFGMSLLCTPNQVASPPIWSQAVKEDYSNTLGALPEYVGTKETNKRRFSDQREIVFASLDNQEPSYDAY